MPPQPLPQGFSEFEHLQGLYRKVMNKLVKEEFSDVDDNSLDLALPRHTLKYACTHKDGDSSTMTQMRSDLFFLGLRKGRDLHPAIYGMPVTNLQDKVYYHPQVKLYFSENMVAAEKNNRTPVDAEITFRLMNETETTITQNEVKKLATKIKQYFGVPIEHIKKGKNICYYRDKKNGYELRLYSETKAEGIRIIKQTLNIQGHTYNDDFLSHSTPEKNSTNSRKTGKKILGKSVKTRAFRPKATVYFRNAFLDVHGLDKPICLLDSTGYYFDAYERI